MLLTNIVQVDQEGSIHQPAHLPSWPIASSMDEVLIPPEHLQGDFGVIDADVELLDSVDGTVAVLDGAVSLKQARDFCSLSICFTDALLDF
jgi:hypothetical protein